PSVQWQMRSRSYLRKEARLSEKHGEHAAPNFHLGYWESHHSGLGRYRRLPDHLRCLPRYRTHRRNFVDRYDNNFLTRASEKSVRKADNIYSLCRNVLKTGERGNQL